MAISKCSCGSTSFELQEALPKGSNYKLFFIQCSTCGNVVSSTDYINVPATLQILQGEVLSLKEIVRKQEKKIDNLVSGMEELLRKIK